MATKKHTVDGSSRVTLVTYTDGTSQVATSYNADGTKASVVQGTGGTANTSVRRIVSATEIGTRTHASNMTV